MAMRKTVIVLASLLLASCGGWRMHPAQTDHFNGGLYVAMGSSMAAGPGLGQPKTGTPARCTRSYQNYPTLLAEKLLLTLVDQSCSGATTDHILKPWNELPAQIDAVTPDTRLVTVTIGGNDLNYVGNLIAAGCGEDGKMTIAGNTFDCPPRKLPSEADYAKVETNLREIARQVKQRAPQATLAFVEYLRLVPDKLCAATPIAEADAAIARQIAQRLADITEKVAKDSRSVLVPVHEFSKKHTPCGKEPWVVGLPANYDGSDGAPWHPNARGMWLVANGTVYQLGKQ